MDEDRLRTIVARLDALVPRRGAAITDDHGLYGSDVDPAFTGNRLGYLRLGIEMLRVADARRSPGKPDQAAVDLSYLGSWDPFLVGEAGAGERWVGVRAPLVTPQRMSVKDALAGIFVLLGVGVVGSAIVAGLRIIWGWVTGP